MNNIIIGLCAYYFIINIISALLTISDKRRAVNNKWRISERTLLIFGFLGGAFLEYFTMKKLHHKTKHKKFMVLLPLEIFMHIILIIIIIYKVALI